MPKQSLKEQYETVINSNQFQTFCDHKCPLQDEGCRSYCPIFVFRINLGGANP